MLSAIGLGYLESRSQHENLMEEVSLLFLGDTEYAAGYSESEFNAVRVGDAYDSVIARLGEPLEEVDGMGPGRVLFYTGSPNSMDYRQRSLVIVEERVTEIIAGMYYD